MPVAPKPDRNEALIADARAGMSIKQLVEKYGISISRVRSIVGKKNKGYRVKEGKIIL